MDRAAFVFWAFATFAVIDIGLISMTVVLARKGYQPRLGLIIGPILGLAMALLATFVLKPLLFIPLEGAQSAIGAVVDEDRPIVSADWDNNGTRAIVWTENDTVSLYPLSAINSPSRFTHQEGDLEHVAWGPDQQSFLTWGSNNNIELWSVIDTSGPLFIMEHESTVVDAVWNSSSDEPKALTWTEGNFVYVWDVKTNLDLPLILPTEDDLLLAAWGEEEENVLLWYADGTVRVWDTEELAAGRRYSTVESRRERNPFLALSVIQSTPAVPAEVSGLQSGDMLLRADNVSFNLQEILAEADPNGELDPDDTSAIGSAVNPIVAARLDEVFANALERGEIEFEIFRNGETFTYTVGIPEISATNAEQEFRDIGFNVLYVGENPTIIPVGESSGVPWSADRDLVMSWSVDNSIKVYEVEDPMSPLVLPYQQDVIGALWSDSNEEIIFWTSDEAFAWNLDDDNVAFRSTDPESNARNAGFILSGDAADAAGLQPGDVLISIAGTPLDVDALLTENAADAITTREYNRALSPIVNNLLAGAAVEATVAGSTSFEVEVSRGGEIITLEIQIVQNDPTANPQPNPNLFPAISIPFLTEDTLGVEAEFINENPRSLTVGSQVVDVAVSSENDYAALLTADEVMYIWSLQTDAEPIRLDGVTHATWNADGTHLLTWQDGSPSANLWITEDITNPVELPTDNNVVDGQWSVGGESFIVVEDGSRAIAWRIENLEEPTVLDHDGNIMGIRWSPDERRNTILVYRNDGFVTTWDLDTGNRTDIELNTRTTFADDLNFGVSLDGFLPSFDVLGARTTTLEFARALLAGLITFIGGVGLLYTVYRFIPDQNAGEKGKALGHRDMSTYTFARQIRGHVLQVHYFIAIVVGMVALSALMWNILKGTFTITAVSQTIDPLSLTDGREVSELEDTEIVDLVIENVEPRSVRSQVRDYVWGVTDSVASAEGEGLAPIYDTSLGEALPDGVRIPEDVTYEELRDPENAYIVSDLMAYNTERTVLERLAVITGMSREDLASELFDTIGAQGTLDLIVSYAIWPEIDQNPDEAYDPEVLQTELNLANTPETGITFNTLIEYPDLLLEALTATGPSDAISRGALEDELYASQAEMDTSNMPTINLFGVDQAAPDTILNRLVADLLVENVLANSPPGRLREVFRIYTWQVDEATANSQSEEPILEVSGLEATPLIPEDLNFVYLQSDPEAMGYILLENLNRTDLETIFIDLVVQPFVVRTWTLDFLIQREFFGDDSIDKELVELNETFAEQAEEDGVVWNDAVLENRSWLNLNFLQRTLNADAELTGMRNAILGTLWMISITILVAFPLGIGAAIYLEEYAGESLIKRVIQTNIDNLAGVPSIIYGMLGLTLFVRALEGLTSGSIFGYGDPTTANGRTILSAALTMSLLILPIIIINSQEAIRAIQSSIRQASYGLGATKWQTVWNHVLPYSMPGILTGTILAMSRAIGETAPLVVIGAATFIVQDPDGPFSKFTALPMQIYFWTSQPRDADKAVAAAAIMVLLAILISLNSFAIILRNRFEKSVRG